MSNERKIECVVLAGGLGTRLRPLTDLKPKPLVRILDTTVLEHVVLNARKISPCRITVSTGYKSDMIEKFCKDCFDDVVCKRETTPLGTAGGVKNCCSDDSDAVLVVSGDAVFDFDLQSAVDFHYANKNDVTIVTSRKENPTEYGVVITDDDNKVVSFCEKPGWSKVRSDLVNTGIYILSKKAVDRIPKGCSYDFSKNLFPELLRDSCVIKSFYSDGFWCDIGTLDEYYLCNTGAAEGTLDFFTCKGVSEKELNVRGIHAHGGVYVSETSFVGRNVKICSKSVVCSGAVIGDNCDISSSIIGKNSRVGRGSSIDGAIIGEDVSVGENCIIPKGTVVGDFSRIADGTVIKSGSRIPSERTVFGEDKKTMDFSGKLQLFKDDGLAVFDTDGFCAELVTLSYSVSTAFKKSENKRSSFSVMCENGFEHLKNIVCSALVSMGENVFDCGDGNEALCSFSVKKLETDAGILLCRCAGKTSVRIFSSDGLFADTSDERKIMNAFSAYLGEDYKTPSKEASGSVTAINIQSIYENSLVKYTGHLLHSKDFDGMNIVVKQETAKNNTSQKALCRVLETMGCVISNFGNKETVSATVSDDGTKSSVRQGNLVLDSNHMCAAIVNGIDVFENESVFFGSEIPAVLKGKIRRENKSEALHCITSDGAVCALTFLALIKQTGENFNDIFAKIPPFEIYTDEYVADINRGATMERLSKLYSDTRDDSGDGICLHLAEGNVTVIPNRARGFRIISEAVNMEAAKELCDKIGRVIKDGK